MAAGDADMTAGLVVARCRELEQAEPLGVLSFLVGVMGTFVDARQFAGARLLAMHARYDVAVGRALRGVSHAIAQRVTYLLQEAALLGHADHEPRAVLAQMLEHLDALVDSVTVAPPPTASEPTAAAAVTAAVAAARRPSTSVRRPRSPSSDSLCRKDSCAIS